MTALSMPRTSATAGPPWPRALERLVTEGLALDAACQRGESVDRARAAEIMRALEEYVDALPEIEQAAVLHALVLRFTGDTA